MVKFMFKFIIFIVVVLIVMYGLSYYDIIEQKYNPASYVKKWVNLVPIAENDNVVQPDTQVNVESQSITEPTEPIVEMK